MKQPPFRLPSPVLFRYCLLVCLLAGGGLTGGAQPQEATAPGRDLPRLSPAPEIRNLAVVEFERKRVLTNHVVLDVRTPREFAGGHVPGAVLLDANAKEFRDQVSQLDRSRTYLVHCAAGVRSDRAVRLMTDLGFTNLFHLPGGYRAWEKAGMTPDRGPSAPLPVPEAEASGTPERSGP